MSIDKRLEEFDQKCKALKARKFDDFQSLEIYHCALINEGNEIRKYLIKNPSLCDENSLKVLTNQSREASLLDEKFKPLANIITLTQSLIIHYENYLKSLLDNSDYHEAIRIFDQLYLLSKNYDYKLNVASLYLKILNQPQKSLETYKEIEPYAINDTRFLWGISDALWELKDYYNQVLYMKKAVLIEMKQIEQEEQNA